MGNNTFSIEEGFLRELSDLYLSIQATYLENQESEREEDPTVDFGLSKQLSKRRTRKHFKELLEVSFWASLKMEEGRHHKFTIVYAMPKDFTHLTVAEFASSLEFTDNTVAKLAPALETVATIGVRPKHVDMDKLEVWGFVPHSLSEGVDRPLIRTIAPGQLLVWLASDVRARVTGTQAEFVQKHLFHGLFESIWPSSPQENWLVESERRDYLRKIGLAMRAHGHGGMLLIIPKNQNLQSAIGGRRFWFEVPYEGVKDTLEKRDGFVRQFALGGLPPSGSIERTPDVLGLIGQLTAVDGATLISPDFAVLGFGAKVNNEGCEPKEVLVLDRFERKDPDVITFENFSCGMRHKSAARFVFSHDGTVAIVASEDGRLSVFKKRDDHSIFALQDLEFLWCE
jgi:hypothetical protein